MQITAHGQYNGLTERTDLVLLHAICCAIVSNNAHVICDPTGYRSKAVCASSGAEPSQCAAAASAMSSRQRPASTASRAGPAAPVNLDTWTGLVAGDACKDFVEDAFVMNVTDPWRAGGQIW